MKNLILIFLFLKGSLLTKAQESIKWISFEEAIILNKENPKPILINIYTNWCPVCKNMDKKTYSNKTIIKNINNNFYGIKMDGEGKEDITYKGHTFKFKQVEKTKNHEFAKLLMKGEPTYPTTIILNEKVEILENISGYISTYNFESMLAFYTDNIYKTKSWKEFLKNFESKL